MAWKHLFKHHSKAGNGFSSPAKAAAELKRQIDVAIREIAFPTGLGAAASSKIVTDGIIHKIEAGSFDRHNQSGIVEVNADFTATRADGSQVFHLRVKWGKQLRSWNDCTIGR
ncbi:hypothetical protein C8034_v012262 [Colletotrichum sidae]|uniref:Uncharacterized protein n=1 Tax=Colletotrichum sidae TaxID=1347389 RepID=A0A4R8THF8_9PEZI|nr:hypothetical protein C8034_v012262 [Colletotrichum sidae]